MRTRWYIALAALLLGTAPAHAQRDLRVEGDWRHAPTGMVFPELIGAAMRTRIHEYDAEGLDISAGYALRRGGATAVVTLYLYPAPERRSCAAGFEEMERSVLQSYTDVRLLVSDRWPSPSGHAADTAYHARFHLIGTLEGKDQPLTSESYLFCPAGGEWLVAARASWPRDADFEQPFRAFLQSLSWPAKLDE